MLAWLALAGTAAGYDQKVHVYLSERAYGGPAQPAGDAAQVAALRERIWRAGAEAKDEALRKRFLARYPTREAFDAWALKRFLGLNPDKKIAGLDEEVPLPEGDGPAAYGLASRLPDDDHRNRDRFRYDDARKVLTGPDGKPLPADPATLEMGSLTGLSSQAHAHYQLPKLAFSDDPAVLKTEPRRFAVPPTVHTFGADYAEVYTQLAVIARRLEGGERLAVTHAGAAAHHIEDVANQIHAVQVGPYAFFVRAKLEEIKEELKSVGGLLRPRPSLVEIAIALISNHHTLAEALYAKHLLTPGDPVRAQTEAAQPDPAFAQDLARVEAGCAPGFGRAIVGALAERSSHEGAAVYERIREVAQPRYARWGHTFEEEDDPDAALQPGADLTAFYALEVRGAERARQALEAWWQRMNACASAPEAEAAFAEALVRERLDALDQADARAKAWTPKAAAQASVSWWVPGLYAGVTVAIVLLVAWRRRRRRARSS